MVWTRVTDAADGQYAQKLEMISRTDGDAKLMPLMDSANCSPTVTVGRPYVLGVSYKSTARTFFALYRQDANGVWSYWTQSPRFAASDTYVAVTWRSPPVPAGTVAVSFRPCPRFGRLGHDRQISPGRNLDHRTRRGRSVIGGGGAAMNRSWAPIVRLSEDTSVFSGPDQLSPRATFELPDSSAPAFWQPPAVMNFIGQQRLNHQLLNVQRLRNRLTVECGDHGRYTFLPWTQTRPS